MTDEKKSAIEVKDLYKTLLDTRNLEINLFWQRSNYFLVLNTGIAFGFFNIKEPRFAIIFAIAGFFASLLWFWVCLGGKYWQTRWEQRLLDFEKEHLPGLDFFSASPERIKDDVEKGFAFHRDMSWTQRLVYKLALKKPSVSYSMIRLAALFALSWFGFLLIFFALGRNPIG